MTARAGLPIAQGLLAAALLALAALALPSARAEGVGDPAPDVRERPPAPPPPQPLITAYDRDHLSAESGLGPPPPRKDPFPLRAVRWRHDTERGSVTARELEVRRIPQWVDTFERSDLVEWRPLELGHHVARLPNVTMGDGGSPFLQIPGMRGFGGDRVRVLTDGVWPSTQALGFFGATLSLWDPETVERVEVYHGPGAWLRGIDAPGGLVNIVTRRPRRHGDGSADVGFSSGWSSAEQRWRSRVEVDAGSGSWAVLAGLSATSVDDRETGDGTLHPSSWERWSADVALDYFITGRSRLGLTAQYSSAQDVRSPLALGSSVNKPGYDRLYLALTLTSFDVGSFFHGTRASFALDSFFQDDDRTLGGAGSGLNGESDVNRLDFHLEGQLDLFRCHTTYAELTVGLGSLQRTESIVCAPRPAGTSPIVGGPLTLERFQARGAKLVSADNCVAATNTYEAEELSVIAILQDECHNASWDWTGGLRADFYALDDSRPDVEDDVRLLVSGAGGLCYHVTQRLSVYGNASLGWRRPSAFELGATEVVDGRVLFGNADLDPELHGNLELGTKMAMKDRWALQAALFAHYTDDCIGPVTLAPGPDQGLENVGDALLVGGELAASWRPLTTIEGLELVGTLGTTRSDDEDVVEGVPLQWRTSVRYSVPQPQGWRVRRWFGDLALHGASASRDGPRGGGAWATADLVLGVGLDGGCGRGGWLNVGVTNLLDEDEVPAAALLPMAGRSVFASLAFDF